MAEILLQDINLGGIADSKYQGSKNSVAQMVGIDVHSEPGIIKVNQKLTKDSITVGVTIDDLVLKILPCTDGNTYLFGSTNGKIWKRTSAGVYTLEGTMTVGGSAVGIVNAIEDQGKIYYFSAAKVGRWVVGTAWSGRNDSWASFTVGTSSYHPVKKVNLIPYIGDGNLVAQIEDDVFTGDALDLKTGVNVTALGNYDVSLLIGDTVSDVMGKAEIFNWNTYQSSFSYSDEIPEKNISAFLDTDNYVLFCAGEKGNIYNYNGVQSQQIKRINGDWGIGKKAKVYSEAVVNYNNMPLFGVSNVSSNPCLQGVYSYARYSNAYPLIMNLEYVISQSKLSSISIGAIAVVDDYILVSWKDGTTYGIDKLDSAAKYTSAYIETRVIQLDRVRTQKISEINIGYRSLPTGTSITIEASKNYAAYSALDVITDTDRQRVNTTLDINDVFALQLKIYPVATANYAPEIDYIRITVK